MLIGKLGKGDFESPSLCISIWDHSEVGERAPVHLSALGKVILAFLEESKLESVLKELTLVQNTRDTFC
ncbi:IclR family transcriptional regulator domain-containing protein [Peribacillus sp. NPDC097895]|uniref:IclR family transcriptional regulator domain-containing protein n=1 Tax=Peribacillus sp. NPDC097895 TaxID=3390619 RepID=UPI003CFFE700